MITSRPRLYYNTGFNVSNIPDSASLLNSCDYLDFDDHVALQDYFLTSFNLKATWDQVKNADYMKYGNAYYFIQPRMINENCAQIYCTLDALTTMGGPSALTYVGGTITRAHAISDGLGENVVPDAVSPSGILVATSTEINVGLPSSGGNVIHVIGSTVRLNDPDVDLSSTIERDGLIFSGEIGLTSQDPEKYTVIIPKAPAAADSTILNCLGGSTSTVGYGLYDGSNSVVRKNLEYIRSLGLSDAILFSYDVPAGMVSIGSSNNGHIVSLSGFSGWLEMLSKNYNSDYTSGILNKKTYFTNNSYVIKSVLSGDMKEFKVQEIMDSNGAISFQVISDPQLGGRSYCAPGRYYGNTSSTTKIANSVKGLPWVETPISFSKASGSQWAKNEYAITNSDRNRFGNSLGELGGVAGASILTNTFGAMGTLSQLINVITGQHLNDNVKMPANLEPLKYEEMKNEMKYAQSQVVAPELSSSPAFGLQNFVRNNFEAVHLHPSAADQARIDKFYTMNGYAQPNIAFDKAYLSGRQYFNYIETSGVHIARSSASNYGITIKNAAEAQLNAGVRIWHTLPTVVNSNPIV